MRRTEHLRCGLLQAVGVAAALLATSNDLFASEPFADKPNIVLILADDLGYGDLSSYGAADLKTPRIDRLAAEGMKFTSAYANCPVCSPTRAALLTGRYPELVGVPGVIRTHASDNWGYLSQNAILLPQVLKKAGYHTAIVGKWHLGLRDENHPLRRGFDHFHGFLGDMMDDYYHHKRHDRHYMRRGFEKVDPKGHATDVFTEWAVTYIAERASTGKPFFLYLAYNAPHTPIQPPADWLEMVKRREPNVSEKRAKLVAMIEHLDQGVGDVVQALKAHGVYDNTLIIFASDNGGQLGVGANNGGLRGGKGQMYEGGIRVPQIAVWSGRIKPGGVTDRTMLTMDWFPTICEIAGVRLDHDIDGVSMRSTLLGDAQAPGSRVLFWTRREGGNRYMGGASRAVRDGDWKLLQNAPDAPFELYNLAVDPQEEHDLREKARKQFNELARKLRIHIQRGGRVVWQPPG